MTPTELHDRQIRLGRCLLVVALLVSASAPAQVASRDAEGVVIPEPGIGIRAGRQTLHGYCSPTNAIYHQLLFDVPATVPNPVRSIAFRRWDEPGSPAVYPAITLDVEIGFGHSPRTPASFSYDVLENRGPDFTIVFRRKISFPPTTRRADNDYPFTYGFPLDRPFSFTAGRAGLVEFRLLESSLCIGANPLVTFEFYGIPRPDRGGPFGVACSRAGPNGGNVLTSGQLSPGNPGDASMTPVSAFGWPNLSRYFGGFRRDFWGGFRLPYALDALGAPGCSLYISYDWEWPTYWGPFFPSAQLDLPNDPTLTGRMVYTQGIRLDRRANSLGVDTSNGWAVKVGPHIDPPLSWLRAPWYPSWHLGQRVLAVAPVFQLSGS